ncbi:DUF5117 domain-containing protein [Aquirufa ecclesiirivi]|uniref:DUF5117 domain-containing protein n=1 Tax=Aquirufa ecclesiirivi TaxID=2715124 RepID=UPI0021D1FB7A|nr:DUF5117 domain-containing protein [Aquirufa ecclesiirivi]
MKKIQLSFAMAVLLMSQSPAALAQGNKKPEVPKTPVAAAPIAETPKVDANKKGPKPYNKVVDSTAVTQKGLFDVHKVDQKFLFEIPATLIDQEIMTITRFSKTPAGGGIFGGEEVNRQVIQFEKGNNNNLLLRSISYVIMSPDEGKPLAQAVKNSSANPIVGIYDILAIKKDSTGKKELSYVIDMTSTFDSDIQTFSLDPVRKQTLSIQAFQKDKSYIQKISSFPINTEIRTVKTYSTVPSLISLSPVPRIGTNLPAGLDAGLIDIGIKYFHDCLAQKTHA